MKKKILLVLMVCGAFIALTSEIASETGIAGRTNSPGESNCTGCHSDYALNSGSGSITVTSTMSDWKYTGGQTYTINLTVAQTGMPLFGMDMEALDATNKSAGTWVVTNTAQNQILSKTVSGLARSNMTHVMNGGASQDSHTFSFNWTAPSSNAGNITFYFAGIAADGNADPSNDYVYTGTQIAQFATGIDDNFAFNHSLNVFPNPASDRITLNFTMPESDLVTAKLYDLTGSLVESLMNEPVFAGNFERSFVFQQKHASGIYFLQLQTKNNTVTKKIVIESNF